MGNGIAPTSLEGADACGQPLGFEGPHLLALLDLPSLLLPLGIQLGPDLLLKMFEDGAVYTVNDLVDRLKVHPDTVGEWLRSGDLDGVIFGGRTGWCIDGEALNRFVAGKKANSPPMTTGGSKTAFCEKQIAERNVQGELKEVPRKDTRASSPV